MKTATLKTFGVVSSLAIILATSVARADILLTNAQTVVVPPSDPPIVTDFTIAQFNPALGTLDSVQLTVSGSASASLIFTNNDGPNGGVNLQESNTFSIVYNNSSALVSNTFFFQTAGYPSYVLVGSGQGYDTNWSQSVGPVTVNYTSTPDLANFTGAGTIPVAAGFDDYFSGGARGGNNVDKLATSGSATATVIYDYTIPEPSTCSLLLAGLAGLLAVARRNKR